MKYGIITHYDVHNHGALLQLYAMKQVLKRFSIEATALQFDKNYDFMGHAKKVKYDISIKSIGVYLDYLMEKGLSCFIYNFKKRNLLNTFKKEKDLIGPYYSEAKGLEGVVIGSDEVFALHTGPTPVLFGYGLPSKNVFSYGGCFGPTTIQDIDRLNCRAFVAGGLSSMSGLSMRDQNSIQIASDLIGEKPELVCDPVILYGFENEMSQQTKRPMREKYMVVYAYDNRLNEAEEYQHIQEYAKRNNLTIVSPGFFHKWVDKNVNCCPIELINWFMHAECVVTDTFHGCVLSIITHRDMAVKLRDNANKLLNLLEEYGLKERKLDNSWDLTNVFDGSIDWNNVNEQIHSRRAMSMSFLQHMILQ